MNLLLTFLTITHSSSGLRRLIPDNLEAALTATPGAGGYGNGGVTGPDCCTENFAQCWACIQLMSVDDFCAIPGNYGVAGCSVNCQWNNWNSCSVTCGGGTQTRTTIQWGVAQLNATEQCTGSDTQDCNTHECPVTCCQEANAACWACQAGPEWTVDMFCTAYNTDPKPENNIAGCPYLCCQDSTAECLACQAGVTITTYCAANNSLIQPIAGCPSLCCQDSTAECLACQAGVTITTYCAANNSLIQPIAGCPPICCQALTAECLSCQQGPNWTIDTYCLTFNNAATPIVGCPDITITVAPPPVFNTLPAIGEAGLGEICNSTNQCETGLECRSVASGTATVCCKILVVDGFCNSSVIYEICPSGYKCMGSINPGEYDFERCQIATQELRIGNWCNWKEPLRCLEGNCLESIEQGQKIFRCTGPPTHPPVDQCDPNSVSMSCQALGYGIDYQCILNNCVLVTTTTFTTTIMVTNGTY